MNNGPLDEDSLRSEFIRLLTTDSPHHDRRRKDYNQAIFDPDNGFAVWSRTDLDMVMSKFDQAVASADLNQAWIALREAARRVSDKRTLEAGGFWVSQREMRYLDEAIAATGGSNDHRGAIR